MTGASPADLPMMLRVGTVFKMNGRSGRIAQNRVNECLILWDEYTDEKTGQVHPSISALLSFFELGCALERNMLHIIARPVYTPDGEEVVREIYKRQRSSEEMDRAFYRLAYVEAAKELIAEGKMGRTRSEYENAIDAIKGRGDAKQTRRAK